MEQTPDISPSPTDKAQQDIPSAQISVVFGGGMLAVAAWSVLIWLVTNTLPTVPNRWAFFAGLSVALTGTAMPIIHYANRQLSHAKGANIPPGVILRQAIWFGLWGTTCVWLMIPRLLSIPMAIVLAIALSVVEALLRLHERSRWQPE